MLDVAFPGMATITSGPNRDDPYPLGLTSIWVDKSTFGRDEVQDAIVTSGGRFPNAFWVVLEGFNIFSFGALSVDVPVPAGSLASLPGVTISRHPGPVDFENSGNPKAPQRIRIGFDIAFTGAALASFPAAGAGPTSLELHAFATSAGTKLPGSDSVAEFELTSGADPYFANIDPLQDNVFWLSQDLRVFTATPGQNNRPVPGGPVFGADSTAGAFSYIQDLLAHLNANFSNPSGPDPFATLLPGQAGALTGDSSVTPFTLDLSSIFNPRLFANYNFAVARVRLRGTAGPAGAAQNARVFFRLWSSQTADTDYQPSSTYLSTLDANGLPAAPLVGAGHNTLPFFATGNLGGNTDYNAGGVNNRTIQIASGDQTWAYFGCFLNLYDAGNTIDGQPVQHWLDGTHHCLDAQIAYDDAPIVNANGVTMSPGNSDKLAQRNLQVTRSDNPGPAATHRVPQTFDVRPSPALQQLPGSLLDYPDELMIDWGNVPLGSVASIYWPGVGANAVLRLAARTYSSHVLTAADIDTIRCEVTKNVTYVPIPPSSGDNFAGLFTIDLPPGVTQGEEFDIVVRRVATRRQRVIERPADGPKIEAVEAVRTEPLNAHAPAKGKSKRAIEAVPPEEQPPQPKPEPPRPIEYRNWRYVTGAFQVKIPVTTKAVMLRPEEDAFAIMTWRLQSLDPDNRWRPVLARYVNVMAGRIDGLGGDSSAIPPSLSGAPVPEQPGGEHGEHGESHGRGREGERRIRHVGKVSGLRYDRFGDFDGFTLETEERELRFQAREIEIERVVRLAWAQRIVTVVIVEADAPRRPAEIILLAPPPPLLDI
jgi:hypothetical protein